MQGVDIREIRESLKLSQQDFGKMLDVSFSTISRWESGKANPSDEQEERLLVLKEVIDNQEIDTELVRKVSKVAGVGAVVMLAALSGAALSVPVAAGLYSLLARAGVMGAIGGGVLGHHLSKQDKRDHEEK